MTITPRGLRNNNPGNIEYNRYTAEYVGCTGTDGRFATFDSMTHGLRALAVLLLTYQRMHGIRTVRDAINRWAPPSENDTGAYVNAVTAEVAAAVPGVGPDTPIDFSDPTVLRSLTVAIGRHENGRAAFDHYCTSDAIDAGVDMALGIRPEDVHVEPSEPVPQPASQPTESKPMLPALIPILLNAIIPQIPILAQAFGKTGEKTAEKVQAAASTLQVITQAVGAANEQDAVQRVANDPAARAAAQAALLADPVFMSLIEVGGGIEAARRQAFDPVQIVFWKTGAFWVSVLLLALPFMLSVDVFYVHPKEYSGELRTQIVTAILVIISVVGAFWLGTTMSSQRKTELLATKE